METKIYLGKKSKQQPGTETHHNRKSYTTAFRAA